jgi:hypothetical protein
LKNGEILLKCGNEFSKSYENIWNSTYNIRSYNDLEDFRDNYESLGNIVKIEEPTYNEVVSFNKPKEMTVEEISKALGYKIIIKEDNENE